MCTIPDFNASELWSVQPALNERYGREIEAQLADLPQMQVEFVATQRATGE